jgi:hypothetical protein
VAAWLLSPEHGTASQTPRSLAEQYCPEHERALRGLVGSVRDLTCKAALLSAWLMHHLDAALEEKELEPP